MSSITLRKKGLLDLSHLKLVVFLSSGGPAFLLLLLGTAIPFHQTRPHFYLISDSQADITPGYICLQGLVIYFILAGGMLPTKFSKCFNRQFSRKHSTRDLPLTLQFNFASTLHFLKNKNTSSFWVVVKNTREVTFTEHKPGTRQGI